MPKNKQKGLPEFVIKAQEAPELPADSTGESTIVLVPKFAIVERDIPNRTGRKGVLDYPIASLKAGTKESFFVAAVGDAVKKTVASIRTFASRNGFKVILREEPAEGGIFVWRKA